MSRLRHNPYTTAAVLLRVRLEGKGEGITSAVVVGAFGAICVAGVIVALWAALRRPRPARIVESLEQIDSRIAGLDERLVSAARPRFDEEEGLGPAIGSTLDLGDVMQRTLAAAEALAAVDGGRVRVRAPDGSPATAVRGLVAESSTRGLEGPPDESPYAFGIASWEAADPGAIRSGLVVPLGEGSLAVYSRLADAFDAEAATTLARIARRAEPAVRNAFEFLEVQERAATDALTGLGSASAFAEALPREVSAARRHGRPLCLIQIDLDDFSRINNVHSHEAGDDVLREFGKRVTSSIRASDAAFRNSGGADEIFVILAETTLEEAKHSYRRLDFEITSSPYDVVETVTMSAGLVELLPDETPGALKGRAGKLEQLAKQWGKNQLVAEDDPRLPPE